LISPAFADWALVSAAAVAPDFTALLYAFHKATRLPQTKYRPAVTVAVGSFNDETLKFTSEARKLIREVPPVH
jgi:hypothetical protein